MAKPNGSDSDPDSGSTSFIKQASCLFYDTMTESFLEFGSEFFLNLSNIVAEESFSSLDAGYLTSSYEQV